MNGDVNGDMYSRVSSEMCITGAALKRILLVFENVSLHCCSD